MTEQRTVGDVKEQLAAAVVNYTAALLEASEPKNVHREILDVVEVNELMVMKAHTDDNQSRSADLMGINRATLRTKLKRHGFL